MEVWCYIVSRKIAEYIIYDNITTLPIFLGTADECCKYLDCTKSTFKTIFTKKNSSKISIYNLDKLLEGYDEYED